MDPITNYDFSGWATRNDLECTDGRTIKKDAFAHCDGKKVPLIWDHNANSPDNILGHAYLENRPEGVYCYGVFNESESGAAAKLLLKHGDIDTLSIAANRLKQQGGNVLHGDIFEVSLVSAGANPGAFIDFVNFAHGDGADSTVYIGINEPISLHHSDGGSTPPPASDPAPESKPDGKDGKDGQGSETLSDVFDTLTEKQKTAVYTMIGMVATQGDPEPDPKPDDKGTPDGQKSDDSKGGDKSMKHNVFDRTADDNQDAVLIHAAQAEIIASAKTKSVGTFQSALKLYTEQHSDTLKHGYDNIEALFPEYKDLRTGAPELITRDQGWVGVVMNKVHKSPISRIRTKNMDARGDDIRAHGYQKGKRKVPSGNMKLIKRTTDPQTIYITDSMHRDDIVDITDFDVVEYQWGVMRMTLNEEIAIAIMIGDGRDEADEHKISEEHIRSIWNDDDLYTIHYDVDIAAARKELQGSRTDMQFGENYIYAEAIITAALYSREKYKGTGTPDLYCTPHMVNIMLLARDMNGRRIYNSKTDLAAALNVNEIHTAEQFEGLARTAKDGTLHKLLGLFVNLEDYTVGHTKGGEITRFNQFDIDFNQEKYLIETRLSGALTRLWSAIALEEPVAADAP